MKRALLFTVFDRPQYWRETCESWTRVDLEGWHVVLRVEPSNTATQDQMIHYFESLMLARAHEDYEIIVNPERYGVLLHPWIALEELFETYDFVVRSEDDLIVSRDVLTYFEWASTEFEESPEVATVNAFSTWHSGEPHAVALEGAYNPWTWGTWSDRWHTILGPTWDKDYSTFNGQVGHQSGFDWNINTRIFPRLGLVAAHPERSRVKNIGAWGVHGRPEDLPVSPGFEYDFGPGQFWVRE